MFIDLEVKSLKDNTLLKINSQWKCLIPFGYHEEICYLANNIKYKKHCIGCCSYTSKIYKDSWIFENIAEHSISGIKRVYDISSLVFHSFSFIVFSKISWNMLIGEIKPDIRLNSQYQQRNIWKLNYVICDQTKVHTFPSEFICWYKINLIGCFSNTYTLIIFSPIG